MTRLFINISIIGSLLLANTTVSANVENGKELHDSNCTSCHIQMQGGDGSGIYTREHKRIESYMALKKQVKRCRDSLGMPWPDDHTDDVVEYLNNTFYQYEK